jgi:predicted metal-dependent peptidase
MARLSPLDQQRLAAARLRAASLQPFFAEALYALQPQADTQLGTFAVDDQWRLYIDPKFLHEWSIPQVAGVLLHEVGHVLRDHSGRAQAKGVDIHDPYERYIWNIAGDIEINDDLIADGAELPGSPCLPESFGAPPGKAAEFYFDVICELRLMPDLVDCGPGAHGSNHQGLGGHDGPAPAPPQNSHSSSDGLSPVEVSLLRKRIAEVVLSTGKRRGTRGGGWERWAEAELRPTIDWRSELSATIRGSLANIRGHSDYSYCRPSRRSLSGIVLPALVSPVPNVALIVDTSASVDEKLLGQAWTEVLGCVRGLGVRRDCLTILAVDTEVHRVKTSALSKRVSLVGGGGTDMRLGFDEVARLRSRPGLIVVLTDGETPWPQESPRARVVVGVLGARGFATVPDWARRVDIPLAED